MQRSSTLENEPIRVEKIGGDDAFRMRQTVDAIKKNIGIGVYVFSAFKDSSQETFFNTTNALISLGDFVSQKDFVSVFSKLNELSTFYTHAIQREWQSDSHIQEKVLAKC